MKKTISILLVAAMLFSLSIAAIPAGAEEGTPVTAIDPDTVGNTVVNDSNRAGHVAELGSEYIPLVNSLTDERPDPEGAVAFSSIFANGENPINEVGIADGGSFYLAEDIIATKTYTAKNITDERQYTNIHGQTKTYKNSAAASNFTIDGCGYSITVSAPLLNSTQDVTFKNVTFTGTVDMGTTNKCGAFSVIAQWNQFDSCNFYNVTSEVTVKSINRAGAQHAVNLAFYGTDCVFNNVKVSSDDTLGADATRVDDMGALIGRVEGKSVFENCVATGNLYVNAKTLAGVDGIGGLVGKVQSGTATFKNCANYRNIIISADTVFQSDFVSHDTDFVKDEAGNATTEIKKGSVSQNTTVGGIVGRIKSAATLENCVNAGKIEFGGKVTIKDKAIGVGGIVGMIENEVTMTNCANTGVLDMKFDASFEGTVTKGDKELKSNALLHRRTYIGGVAGYGNAKKIALENCSNSGAITLDKCATAGLGGVIGCVEDGVTGHTFTNCDNSGEIKFQNGAKLNQPSDNGMGIGGVLGISKASKMALTDCDNSAKVTYTLGNNVVSTEKYKNDKGNEVYFEFHTGVCGTGGIMGYQYVSGADTLSLINCHNTGALVRSAETTAGRFLGGVIGGVRGVKNTVIDRCSNSSDLSVPGASGWSSVGGIVGQYASIGNWMHNGNSGIEATFDVRRCTNTGNINSIVDAGGMLGANNEIEATKLVTTFYGCVNQGNVTVTGNAYAGGMYGIANAKGTINFEYCVNSGDISSNSSAGGLVSVVEAKLTNFLVTNCKNEGDVTANATTTPRAGGLAARIAVANGGKVEILNSANTGAVESKGDTANGIAGGIAGSIADVTATMNGNVNKGTVKCATASAAAPIVANQTKLASGTNYYLKGCATGSFTHGTAEDSVDTRLASMVFAVSGDSFHLKKLIASIATLVQSDYEPATWTNYSNAFAAANTVANNVSYAQAAIDEAKANLEAKIAALDPKALDLTKYNEVMGKFDELDPGAYSGNSFLVVTEAVKVVEAIKADENGLQSKFDVALQAVLDAIGDLEVKGKPGGTIDVEQKGQLTLKPLRPQKTTASTPEATEPTEETTTAATTAAKKRGCGGLIGGATVVATAVLAIGVGVSLKKEED